MASEKLTKKELQEKRREQARLAREAEKKREKRNRLILQGGIVLGVLAILAVVALVLTQSTKPVGPGPQNMVSGGVTFGTDLQVVPTPALQEGETRAARDVDWEEPPLDVVVYVDYMCPACGNFESQYGTMLENYAGNGDITLTVYPLNFLDGQSLGTKYSTRAANLMACIVDQQPEYAFALHTRLLSAAVQPEEKTTGLTDEQLVEQAAAAGADADNQLKQCVKDRRFAGFISANYKAVSEGQINGLVPGARIVDPRSGELQPEGGPQRLMSTPTVIVNGQQWYGPRDGDLETYLLKLLDALEGGEADEAETAE